MGFGYLSKAQKLAIKPYVSGCEVLDLGAGDLSLSRDMLRFGATHVVAIDKEIGPRPPKLVTKILASFTGYAARTTEPIQVALISWPVNWPVPGLVELVAWSNIVIYLGTNSDGNACGFSELWKSLSKRTVIEHVPERENTLIIYGRDTLERENLPEEWAALNQENIWSFESLHARKAS